MPSKKRIASLRRPFCSKIAVEMFQSSWRAIVHIFDQGSKCKISISHIEKARWKIVVLVIPVEDVERRYQDRCAFGRIVYEPEEQTGDLVMLTQLTGRFELAILSPIQRG